jgi:RNA-directed DNA polymerase
MEGVSEYITRKLKLKVNEGKSAVGKPQERKFLGFSFLVGKKVKRKISVKTMERFKERIRRLTKRSMLGMAERVKELARYMRGWVGYYGFCETPETLRDLEAWVRRRLRVLVWKQWNRGRRYHELRKRGIGTREAWNLAGGSRGPWRASRSRAMNVVLPNAYFSELGLPKMLVWTNA